MEHRSSTERQWVIGALIAAGYWPDQAQPRRDTLPIILQVLLHLSDRALTALMWLAVALANSE